MGEKDDTRRWCSGVRAASFTVGGLARPMERRLALEAGEEKKAAGAVLVEDAEEAEAAEVGSASARLAGSGVRRLLCRACRVAE